MKTPMRNQALLLGATLLGTMLFASAPARAVDINQTVTQSGAAATGWSAAIWGSPAAVPLATTNYITPNAFFVRTPNNSTPAAFAGSSLRIDAGGVLWLKHSGGAASVNLVMNGGTIQFHGGTATTPSPLSGTIQVLANSLINSDQTSPNDRSIWLQSPISGNANLTVAMVIATNAVILSGSNSAYAGNWTNASGFIQIVSGTTNALGSGGVTLVNANTSLTINSTNNMVINNLISGLGSVIKQNTNTVTLGGNNTYAGSTTVSNGVLKLASSLAISNSAVITLAGSTLDASAIGGLALSSTIFQTLKGSGAVVGNLAATTGTTNVFNLTPTTNDILNVTGSLTLNGNPTMTLTLTGYKPSGTYRLINYTGTIQGGGAFAVVPPVGSAETFVVDTTTPGQVNLVVTGIPQDLIWAGGSGLWDTASANWTGTATIYSSGDNVTFNDSGTSPVDVSLAVSPSLMMVSNNVVNYQFYDLGITTLSTLTKKGSGTLEFTSPANNFNGAVDIQAGVLSIGAGGSFGSLGAPTAITNNGVFRLNMSSGGAAVNVPISGSGSVEVLGGGVLVLNGTNTYSGLTTINDQCQLNITTSSALGSPATGTVILANGRLGVTSFVGSLTNPEPVTVNGTGVTAAPGALYLNTPNNNLTYSAPITIASDARFRVVNVNARMNFANTVLGTGVALWCTAGNAAADTNAAIVFQNTFSIGSGALTKDGQGIVAFNSANNVCGSVTINGGTVQANGILNGGTVTVNATGALGGSGNNLGPVVVTGGSVAPGNSGIGTLTLGSTLSLDPASTMVMEINRTNAQNADLLVASAIPFNGTLTVVNTGPALQVGDTFNLFDGSISGAFTATNLPAFALTPNYTWDTSLLQSQGIIKVTTNSLPLLPLLITHITVLPTNVELTWNSYPSLFYSIEYSTNLFNWSVAESGIAANAVTNSTVHALSTIRPVVGNSVTMAQYQMGTYNAQIQDAANLVASSSLQFGSGVSLSNATAILGYPTDPVLQVTANILGVDLATAFANQTWITFTITVGTNVTDLDLTSLSFNGARGGAATPRGYGVYATTPTTTDEVVQVATDLATVRPTWSLQNINLTGFASLQNLTNGQSVTFKIPFYSPAAASSLEFDDITVKGNVSPGPLPAYSGGDKLFLRVKQQ